MRKQPHRRFGVDLALRYSLDMARAIAELHSCAIIIQDLKPANILMDEFDSLVVADFGLSAVIEGTRLGTRTVKGTFNYMAPEAFDPIGAGGLTVKADCWSWACCVIELFTGRPPWENDRMAVIMQKVLVARQKPRVPAEVPEPVAQLLRQCFSSNPSSRPSFSEMLPVLQQTLVQVGAGAGISKIKQERTVPQQLYLKPAAAPNLFAGHQQQNQKHQQQKQHQRAEQVVHRHHTDARAARYQHRQDEMQVTQGGRGHHLPVPQLEQWVAYKDPKGRPYYYNKITRKTQWEHPKLVGRPEDQLNLQPGRKPKAGGLGREQLHRVGAAELHGGAKLQQPGDVPSQPAGLMERTPLRGARQATADVGTTGNRIRKVDISPEIRDRAIDARASLLQAQQRMAEMLGTGNPNLSPDTRGSNDHAGLTKSVESSPSIGSRGDTESESGMSATAEQLQSEAMKCRDRVRRIDAEMRELLDQKHETLRTGRMPGDKGQDSRRKYISTYDDMLQELQRELRDITSRLGAKKRALCELCRDAEDLRSLPDVYSAQEQFDEALLQLQEKQDACNLLRLEQKCCWLTSSDGAVTYLEQIQMKIVAKEEELQQICELERDTQNRKPLGRSEEAPAPAANQSAGETSSAGESRPFQTTPHHGAIQGINRGGSTGNTSSDAANSHQTDDASLAAATSTTPLDVGTNDHQVGHAVPSVQSNHSDGTGRGDGESASNPSRQSADTSSEAEALAPPGLRELQRKQPDRAEERTAAPRAVEQGGTGRPLRTKLAGATGPRRPARVVRDRRGSADAGVLARARAMLEKREGKGSS
eukprot:SAG31_NODE_422_length_15859_cov_5.161865_9_plen_816_part_00